MRLVKCLVKANFGFRREYFSGEVREFTQEEADRMPHIIEPVEKKAVKKGSNKKYKGGKDKSK